jgi:amino acid transporter
MPTPQDDRDSRQDSAGGARDDLFSEDAELSSSMPGGEPRRQGYLRIRRQDLGELRQAGTGHLVAAESAGEARRGPRAMARRLRIFLTGRTLDTEALETERLSILRALPILSSDALSSVAYGPEVGLSVLAAAGAGALILNVPIGIAIALLMVIVTTSYRQVVRGYPSGGGSYAVARANLGVIFGLIAAAALLIDYVLTVAVSVSSSVDALASAFAALSSYKVPIGVALVGLLVVGNLRGVREAGAVFALPTYLFIVSMLVLMAVGLVRGLLFGNHAVGHYAPIEAEAAVTPLLVLTAFASGSSSMTGIEAVSNSVPSFQRPEARHAALTLTILGSLLVILFLGVVALDVVYGAEPHPGGSPTVLSQIAEAVFQGTPRQVYYAFQFATLLVLVLAANTSFNGFPRLSAVLARDDFLPHRFAQIGNRLVYSTAIVLLGGAAAVLMAAFQANTDSLVNLYALGVFTAFTLAQTAMARGWWRERGPGWRRGLVINGCGGAITAVVDVVIIVTKSPRGAWVVLLIIPLVVLLLWSISRYYAGVRTELAGAAEEPQPITMGGVLVPVFRLDASAHVAFRYAMAVSPRVTAVHLARNRSEASSFRDAWDAWPWPAGQRLPRLYARVCGRYGRVRTFLAFLDTLQASVDGHVSTVVLPQLDPPHPLRDLLGRPAVARFKLALLRRSDVVTTSIPSAGVVIGGAAARDAGQGDGNVAIVPIADLDAPARRALAYAAAIAARVVAVHVDTRVNERAEESEHIANRLLAWKRHARAEGRDDPIHLVVIESPYRSVVPPLLAYVDSWRQAHPEPVCTVVLPEVVADHWWAYLLHNHRASWLKAALLRRSTVAVADVTYHLLGERSS